MMKVREKISGTLRNADHGRADCELRGIISSARKQSRAMLDTLKRLVTAPETHGAYLAAAQQT